MNLKYICAVVCGSRHEQQGLKNSVCESVAEVKCSNNLLMKGKNEGWTLRESNDSRT